MEFPIKELLALGWHTTDGVLQMTGSHKKTRALWVGLGVGWSAFWVIRYFAQKARFVEIKPWSEHDR